MDEIEFLKQELEQTRLAYQMVSQINQFKTGFLGRTAHEIRSPLSQLMSLHQLILADLCESPAEEREFIDQAYKAAHKLVKIIDQVILVSKLEYGRISLQQNKVNLQQVVRDLEPLISLQAANRNLKLNVVESSSPIYILADEQRLLMSLINLVDTAINWTEQGTIEIQLTVCPNSSRGIINIRTPCFPSTWQESTDLLQQSPEISPQGLKEFAQKLEMSAGEKFLLSFNLIEAMGGQLMLNSTADDSTTQLGIAFPLVEN